jgi:GNAT superfamily N-acetyltransferase
VGEPQILCSTRDDNFMDGTQSEIKIREALPTESVIILHHRRSMFRDMGEGTVEELDQMVEVARPWLARALADGSYHHWLALDSSGRVAGGGGVLLCPWPANPKDPCTERAVILNVYTEKEFRKRGIARQIMLAIMAWIKKRGLRGVNLHASDEGRRLYKKLGFEVTNEMRLRFDVPNSALAGSCDSGSGQRFEDRDGS